MSDFPRHLDPNVELVGTDRVRITYDRELVEPRTRQGRSITIPVKDAYVILRELSKLFPDMEG